MKKQTNVEQLSFLFSPPFPLNVSRLPFFGGKEGLQAFSVPHKPGSYSSLGPAIVSPTPSPPSHLLLYNKRI